MFSQVFPTGDCCYDGYQPNGDNNLRHDGSKPVVLYVPISSTCWVAEFYPASHSQALKQSS